MEEHSMEILHSPTQKERFKRFAASHFTISILGAVGAFFSIFLGGAMLAVLFIWEGVLLALYALAGARVARKRNWQKPQGIRDCICAFLSPTLVAWIWGGIFLVFLCIPGLMSGTGGIGDMIAAVQMYILLLLAFPSSFGFIMLALFTGGLDAAFTVQWPMFFLYLIIVGAVPPGLFLLGSTLGAQNPQEIMSEPQE